MPIPIVAVVGPTASGKTSLAVELALRTGGEVISADSMQIYAGMPVATAQPDESERRGVPHHLIGFLPPSEDYSVARFVEDAGACARDIASRGRLPILAGGTGLYVDALLQNIRFEPMPENADIRARLLRRAEEEGPQPLWDELAAVDPETAAAVHPRNVTRVVRALEVYLLTGETISARRRRSRAEPSPYKVCWIGLDYADRAVLYDRIGRRVDRMLGDGLLDECRAQLASPLSETSAQAIGYKELAPYLAGLLPLEECVENLKRATCRYAKRQLTWFRRNPEIHWMYPDRMPPAEILERSEKAMAITFEV